ncbi:cysteine-rich receptor-like protein kinase 2 [Rutidosis leptorrhynchoides]|uniref:cysteine-rich receptor-like protein kinase 2 n=1 Tax=Rutidosis leptorrhynchoides TaxID=125765 RepID=UPI003A999ED5
MQQVKNRQFPWWLTSLLVVVVMIIITSMAEHVTSQPTDRNSTLMRYYCSMYKGTMFKGMNEIYFFSNLNTTLSGLRRQLTTQRYATVRTLFNGEPVWGHAQCRGYLSLPDCLNCFDYAVDQIKVCGAGNGATAIFTDCEVRYENRNFATEVAGYRGVTICDKVPETTEFQKAGKKLLLDLQIATPKTSDFYALSTRQVANGNATIYAIAQCNPNITQSVCSKCLKMRSDSLHDCLPAISGRATGDGCFMRYSRTPFFRQNQTTDISSLILDGETFKSFIIQGVVGGVSFILVVLAFFLWYGRLKTRGTYKQELKGTVTYRYKDLQLATNNFSEKNIIGKGGFGEVFKAVLNDNKAVAVKKLKIRYGREKIGFENEILLTSQIRHRNLLHLLGWSSEESELLLVLEYMPNGSLDTFLWGAKKGALNWKQRYEIILGIARGLAHLHKEFHVKIVHRDIKSSNILLDDNFQPKIADFGLARFQQEDQSHVITKFAGTLGYTAPEYVLHGVLSDKVDTFSFGIVILEIISGQKCTYSKFDGSSTQCLLEQAWKLYEHKNHIKLVDETMDDHEYEDEHVMKIIEIALLCTQSPASKRPTMSQVVSMLLNISTQEERQISKPIFIDHNTKIDIKSS